MADLGLCLFITKNYKHKLKATVVNSSESDGQTFWLEYKASSLGPLVVSSLGGVEIKFSIFFIMFLLIFHVYVCSFMYDEFTFPNAD